ncbi:tripartite ATP-independent transporter solute receptor, DctP family [Natronincola peptidivorans]|uniref:Tripartite ATP-independent transporter solute receptor, DctP family n=1 Tax=Natronincola peptidivorans TaxID=426128 RepID=A0A1I0BLR0_9FIRM|nr:DctP family TRAP transporter solute-binding subunit [Natronincola peptidivorans]SET07896.1 tripartite ATP-independent transporter solute receptor, DctP family [Natronincola peptidivorans]
MKKRITLLLVCMLVVSLMAGCSSSPEAPAGGDAGEAPAEQGSQFDAMTLRMSVTTADTSPWYKGAERFAELVSERTDGQVTINIFPNEQLSNGNQPGGIEQLQNGVTDLSYHSTIIYSVLDPKYSVISMPWILPNNEMVDAALNGAPGQAIKDLTREKGIEPLAFGENGFRQVTNSRRAIASPEDMAGMKIRIPAMQMYTDLYRALGADPTVMNFAEVFTALQQGAIDGQENPLAIIVSSNLYEVQDQISLWNYSYDALILGMNKAKFDSMSPELQTIFSEAAEEASAYQVQLNREAEAANLQFLIDQGMTVTELTDEQIEAFRQKVIPVYEAHEEIIGKELMDMFR